MHEAVLILWVSSDNSALERGKSCARWRLHSQVWHHRAITETINQTSRSIVKAAHCEPRTVPDPALPSCCRCCRESQRMDASGAYMPCGTPTRTAQSRGHRCTWLAGLRHKLRCDNTRCTALDTYFCRTQ